MLLVSRLTQERMSLIDIVFHRSLFVLILIEFFADQQQWSKYYLLYPFSVSPDIRFSQYIPQTSNKRNTSTNAPRNFPQIVNTLPKI